MKRDFCLLILLSCFACAGARRGEHAAVAAKSWVDETLAGLSLEQKVGQMIYPRSDGGFVNASDPEARTLIEAARSGRIGGVVFFKGEPYETAAIVNRLQQASKLPLLMASDYEWGTAMRVGGGTRFPRAMAMGAGARLVDMEFQAEVTAREARAYGIHPLLNPVLDLSTNPKNRVITTRSFGQDPQRAGELGAAYIERASARRADDGETLSRSWRDRRRFASRPSSAGSRSREVETRRDGAVSRRHRRRCGGGHARTYRGARPRGFERIAEHSF